MQHQHRGVAAVQRLVEFAPSTGGLALWVRHQDLPESDPAADTGEHAAEIFSDGRTVFYRPRFDDLPLPVQTGWVAHQVLHIALRHSAREAELRERLGDVDPQLFNLCADAIVNSALEHLAWLQLPARVPTLDSVLSQVLGAPATPGASPLLDWDVERLYAAIDDRRPPRSGGRQGKTGKTGTAGEGGQRPDGPKASRLRAVGAGTARDLRPSPTDDASPEQEAEATREWGERLQRAHAGDGAFSLLRTLLADLPQVRTPWEQVLRRQAAHALSQKPGLSWSRPTRSWLANQGRAGGGRRLPWTPGTTASQAVPKLVLVLDASGSVEDALLARFAREVQALSRRLEAALVLIVGDTAVHSVQTYRPGQADLRDLRLPQGGGTDFAPLITEALRHRPDLIVVLTDLDGPAGTAPRCPVLWAVPEASARAPLPFGRLLVLR